MSKLLDRLHIHTESSETLHEAPERVPESQEVIDHRVKVTAPPRRAASGIRWLRWLPVVALLAAGTLALTMLASDSTLEVRDATIEWPTVAEGPGSNSLGPTAAPAAISSYQLVQDSIDAALLENQISALDRAVLDLDRNATRASSYQLVQDSIDAALLENQISALDRAVLDLDRNATRASSYQLVQDSIDAALAANQPRGGPNVDLPPELIPVPAPAASSYQQIQDAIDAALAANN